ncbi:ABC transporter permease [Labrys miyagiensis]|uniref:ABC transporter permease n=1 Tax=Labrys miyagiensis TaxID=346912 RepID=A0ABQ6CG98_9HYPH|nr:ABC transporter permease [Labrys miyagiensis]GLS19383.1 ABC transporter permease [Labrys miyagiensis]
MGFFYILRRLLLIIPTLIVILLVTFVIVRLLPGDPASAMIGDRATDADVARINAELGLDQPLPIQFLYFVKRIVTGDLGTSFALHLPVAQVIAERLPITLMLTGLSALFAVILAVPLAFIAALSQDRAADLAIREAFQIGLSMPVFYIGLVLLTIFAANLRWFPVGGYGDDFGQRLYHLFLPALTIAFSLSAILMRNLRAAIIGVLGADYVNFARSKGLATRIILSRHVLRNALISTVTLLGLHIGTVVGSAVITETVFAIPGIGRLMIDSIYARDYPVVQGLTIVLAVLVSLIFLATDLVQAALDPRVAR